MNPLLERGADFLVGADVHIRPRDDEGIVPYGNPSFAYSTIGGY